MFSVAGANMTDVAAGDLRYTFGTFPAIWGIPVIAFLSRSSVAMNLSAGALISRETSSVHYSMRRCWLTRGILPTIRASIVEAR